MIVPPALPAQTPRWLPNAGAGVGGSEPLAVTDWVPDVFGQSSVLHIQAPVGTVDALSAPGSSTGARLLMAAQRVGLARQQLEPVKDALSAFLARYPETTATQLDAVLRFIKSTLWRARDVNRDHDVVQLTASLLASGLSPAELSGPRAALGSRLAELVNAQRGRLASAGELVLLVNALHDGEQLTSSSDSIRASFMDAMSPEAALRVLLDGYEDAYPSTFQLLARAVTRDRHDVRGLIERAALSDNERNQLLDLVASNLTADIAYAAPEVMAELVLRAISPEQLASVTAETVDGALVPRVSELLARIYPALSTEVRGDIETRLHDALAGHPADSPPHTYAAFLSLVLQERGLIRHPGLTAAAQSLRPLPRSIVAGVLQVVRERGRIVAVVHFADDQGWLDATRSSYVAAGFRRVNRGRRFGGAREETFERKDPSTGLIEEVTLAAGGVDPAHYLGRSSPADIVAIRGHVHSISKVLRTDRISEAERRDLAAGRPRVLLIGACNGFELMTRPGVSALYGHNAVVADLDVGEGVVNARLLLDVMRSLPGGPSRWDEALSQYERLGVIGWRTPAFAYSRWRAER